MVQKDFCILLPEGLHLRPAGIFCSEAAKYSCDIRLKSMHKEVNGKSLLGVIGAMVKCGDTITLKFSGENESDTAEAIKIFLEEHNIAKEVI